MQAMVGETIPVERDIEQLPPLSSAIQGLQRRVDDTVLEAQSECWWAATALYTALARASGAEPKLEAALEPIIDFFSVGRRTKTSAGK
jgi:hypothetical protein